MIGVHSSINSVIFNPLPSKVIDSKSISMSFFFNINAPQTSPLAADTI